MLRRTRPSLHPVDVVRLAWGAILLWRPQPVLRAARTEPDAESVLVARVLGARHVAQAVAVAVAPLSVLGVVLGARATRRAAAVVDLVHAASAFALAAARVSPTAWAADGAVASAFAATTWRDSTAR
jgi:hypothetical protein